MISTACDSEFARCQCPARSPVLLTTMRFSAPRSTSPSPERIQFKGPSISRRKASSSLGLGNPLTPRRSQIRRSSTYGIHSDSESESSGSEQEHTVIPVDLVDGVESRSDVDLTDAFKYVSISPARYVSFIIFLLHATPKYKSGNLTGVYAMSGPIGLRDKIFTIFLCSFAAWSGSTWPRI